MWRPSFAAVADCGRTLIGAGAVAVIRPAQKTAAAAAADVGTG